MNAHTKHPSDVVIIGGARPPQGKFLGALKPFNAVQLGPVAVKAAVSRSGIDPAAVYEVIRNAIHYGPVGGRVKITLQKAGDFAQIAVQDQGRGISAKDQESIWEVLSQIDRIQNEQQGSGMGLPIVKQTVLLHGGTVSLQSELGKGTLVILSLPLHRA